MAEVKAIILRTAGTNCDQETEFALQQAGAETSLIHIKRVIEAPSFLSEYHILALPGGFTYGDDVAAGKILANELRYKLYDQIGRFIADGKLVIGICNGFQALVKAGLLQVLEGSYKPQAEAPLVEATLTNNDSGKFEDRWVYLEKDEETKCVFTQDLDSKIYLPVAHGEGKFITRDQETLSALVESRQIVLRYVDDHGNPAGYPWNPNGSTDRIAGICDLTGRIFGLMPHPERHIHPTQHPRWTREGLKERGDGMAIFQNAVRYAKQSL